MFKLGLFANPLTIARQAPLSTEFSRQEYWNGLPFRSPGDLLNPGTEHGSPTLQADSLINHISSELLTLLFLTQFCFSVVLCLVS